MAILRPKPMLSNAGRQGDLVGRQVQTAQYSACACYWVQRRTRTGAASKQGSGADWKKARSSIFPLNGCVKSSATRQEAHLDAYQNHAVASDKYLAQRATPPTEFVAGAGGAWS